MDYYYSYVLHDVADKVGVLGLVGAVAAGLAAFALLSGVAQLKRKTLPKAFPGDAEALQTKYYLAYKQLEHMQDAGVSSGESVDAAEQLARGAFTNYTQSSAGALKR